MKKAIVITLLVFGLVVVCSASMVFAIGQTSQSESGERADASMALAQAKAAQLKQDRLRNR